MDYHCRSGWETYNCRREQIRMRMPAFHSGAVNSPNLCKCSEGFAELMFSQVFGFPVTATLQKSVICGDKHCVYEIVLHKN